VGASGEAQGDLWGSFRLGLTLFNEARFFEAHEALEDAWRESGSEGGLRRHLQGVVQLAVAFHHQSQGNFVGARSVLDRALRNLSGGEESLPDIDLDGLRGELAAWQRYLGEVETENAPALPQIARRGSAVD
jgi:hypothetical protein